MEKMLVVIFDNEVKAYEASRALAELDGEGSISIHAESVIQKNPDGTVTVKQAEDDFPIGALGGTALGSLIGLLGGPIGLGIGATAGATLGLIGDVYIAGVNSDFLVDVAGALTPGKFAVVADISEEWVTPVDARMEALGGVVVRTTRDQVEEEQRAREEAAMRTEIDQLKAEYEQARADRKAKLQARIDALNTKLEAKRTQAKQRSEQIKSEVNAKVGALQAKAAQARDNAKGAINARIHDIQQSYEESVARMKSVAAEQLRKAANTLEAGKAVKAG